MLMFSTNKSIQFWMQTKQQNWRQKPWKLRILKNRDFWLVLLMMKKGRKKYNLTLNVRRMKFKSFRICSTRFNLIWKKFSQNWLNLNLTDKIPIRSRNTKTQGSTLTIPIFTNICLSCKTTLIKFSSTKVELTTSPTHKSSLRLYCWMNLAQRNSQRRIM